MQFKLGDRVLVLNRVRGTIIKINDISPYPYYIMLDEPLDDFHHHRYNCSNVALSVILVEDDIVNYR